MDDNANEKETITYTTAEFLQAYENSHKQKS